MRRLRVTEPHAHRSKVATLLARVVAGITADVLQLAARLHGSERLLRREVEEYRKDPSAGASKGLCSIKVGGRLSMVHCMLHASCCITQLESSSLRFKAVAPLTHGTCYCISLCVVVMVITMSSVLPHRPLLCARRSRLSGLLSLTSTTLQCTTCSGSPAFCSS